MHKVTIMVILLTIANIGLSQNVSDVIENGINVRNKEKIYIIKSGLDFKFDIGTIRDFQFYEDSSLFLIHRSGINIFLQPLNPLKYSYDTASSFIPDPINEAADKAFTSITTLLSKVIGSGEPLAGAPSKDSSYDKNSGKTVLCVCPVCSLDDIKDDLEIINKLLAIDPKARINSVFSNLRESSFENKDRTYKDINIATDSLVTFKKYFEDLNKSLKDLELKIEKFKCDRDDSLIAKYVLIEILSDLKTSYGVRYTRFKNLQQALAVVRDAADRASMPSINGEIWFGEPINVRVKKGQISLLGITVNSSGSELKNDEIVVSEKKVQFKKLLRFRKFQIVVPEVSAGVAYTMLSFPKYGTKTDGQGNTIVSDAGEETFKKVNFTAMINWVFYTHTNVSPFIQLGIGAKTDYPTLFLGGGGRFHLASRVLAISIGGAATWIKQLGQLNIGDTISGTSELEKDLSHQFKSPKLYFGIQYNF